MKKLLTVLLASALLLSPALYSCSNEKSDTAKENENRTISEIENKFGDAESIVLADGKVTVNGVDAVYGNDTGVYTANDIVYYPQGKDFTFGEGTEADAHSEEEAAKHTVVHITNPGEYVLSGKLSYGQIAVDLGEDAKADENSKVTLILNGVDINCDVAPAVIFYNVYECCAKDEESASKDVDTANAGANVIIADGTVNNINGSYVARIYKSVELNEEGTEVVDSKKLHKYDSAFYSKMTMNVNGEDSGDGILNIKADNEGLDSELHLTINGGIINIESGNDGINTTEDDVSVTTLNGGSLNIVVNGSTGEGD
ncbi:MAG: carbohydrate-binding domain-containing protein, partial [Clostridia bacterium]|nr:carbohydrate-binding domain-containing protein [Clostridia bacterium]